MNGRLVGFVEILNDAGPTYVVSGGEVADYDVEVHDFTRKTKRAGRVGNFQRDDGALELVKAALNAVA